METYNHEVVPNPEQLPHTFIRVLIVHDRCELSDKVAWTEQRWVDILLL